MTTKQKIAVAIGSGILITYATIFIFQRINRAKADRSKVSEDEANLILMELKLDNNNPEPEFTEEDIMIASNTELSDLQQSELLSGMGDY